MEIVEPTETKFEENPGDLVAKESLIHSLLVGM